MRQAAYYSDLSGLINALGEAGSGSADDVTTQIIHSMGEEIGTLARKYAPQGKTGELRNSIVVRNTSPLETRIAATAPHAVFVEFGTWSHNVLDPKSGTYEIRPKNPDGFLRFIGRDGQPVFTKVVNHPGIEPNPFMKRASEEVLDDFAEQVGAAAIALVMQ